MSSKLLDIAQSESTILLQLNPAFRNMVFMVDTGV